MKNGLRSVWTKHYWRKQVAEVARKACDSTLEQEDFEQEIWLAVCEGRLRMEELRTKAIRTLADDCNHLKLRSRQDRYAPFDVSEIEISLASKAWHRIQLEQRTAALEAYKAYQPPTQIEDVWASQVRQKHMELSDQCLSLEEVATMMEAER